MAHGPSCSAACGIFPDQGSNPGPCIGRQILNHCATREVPSRVFKALIPNLWARILFLNSLVGIFKVCVLSKRTNVSELAPLFFFLAALCGV